MNSISFSCSLTNLQSVRDFVRKQLDTENLSSIEKNHIVLAIDEVCTNLIIHSNKNDERQTISLNMILKKTPKGIAIELIETGEPFDYLKYKEPNILELKEKQSTGKMGMILVRKIMDKVEYFQKENHNICRLYKALA